jgi:ribonuclease E
MTAGERILVNARDPEEIRVARVVDGKLAGIHWAGSESNSQVGSIHLGEIRQVEEGLEAVFVDFAGGRAGFLHGGDIHPALASSSATPFEAAGQPVPETEEGASFPPVSERIEAGRRVLVQVQRDSVKGKGATLTTFLSLPGKLLVLFPSMGKIALSRRIEGEQARQELIDRVRECGLPEGMGAIARTAAARSSVEDLQADLEHLLGRWAAIEKGSAQAEGPGLLLPVESPVRIGLRDQWTPTTREVVVDDPSWEQEARDFLGPDSGEGGCGIRIWEKNTPLFEAEGVEKDYQALFQARVSIGSGASIVIQETEALTAVDVNSGRLDRGSLEETALATNLLAAEELARQIRLRDLGGILVVDFIDQRMAENRSRVEEAFSQALRGDRSRLKMGRLTSFGLLPMTRRRKGTGMAQARDWSCKECGGGGNTSHVRAGALRVIRRLRAESSKTWKVRLQPAVAGHLEQEFPGIWKGEGQGVQWQSDPQVPAGEPVMEEL